MPGPGGGNSILVICWHVAGNLRSRFTDFLTSDGEKPWRNREEEFQDRAATRAELLAHWEMGWSALLDALAGLTDSDLARTVTIRGQPLRVHEALLRSLAHVSYHVGQVVYAARALRGGAWRLPEHSTRPVGAVQCAAGLREARCPRGSAASPRVTTGVPLQPDPCTQQRAEGASPAEKCRQCEGRQVHGTRIDLVQVTIRNRRHPEMVFRFSR